MDRPHCWIFIAHCWCNVGGEFQWSLLEPSRPVVVLTVQLKSCTLFFGSFLFVYQVLMTEKEDAESRANCHERLKYWIQSSQTVEIMCHNLLRWVRYSQYWAHVVPWKKKNNKGDATLKRLSFLLAIKFNHNQVCWKHARSFRPRFKTFKAAAFRK